MKLIADVGSNWRTLDDCMKAIRFAKLDGVDIVKFQYFTHKKLYGTEGRLQGELPKSWISRLKAECDKQKIGFMCSVFDTEDIAFIDKFVDVHKIASPEAWWPELVTGCLATGKPVIISTGSRRFDNILRSNYFGSDDIIPMACISEYPANRFPIQQIIEYAFDNSEYLDCYNIEEFGISNHCIRYGFKCIYDIAMQSGAAYLECHYNPLNIESCDSNHSFKSMRLVAENTYEKPVVKRTMKDGKWYR